jgi:hypothetical protein
MNGPSFRAVSESALSARPSEIERDLMEPFEQIRNPLLRYAYSFGIPMHDAEEVVQEAFLSCSGTFSSENLGKTFADGSFGSYITSRCSTATRTNGYAR